MRTSRSNLDPTFFDKWGLWILIFTLALLPGAFYSAGKAVQSNVNKVEDWLPKTFEETKQLAWFRKHFASDQFVVISWDGCQLGDVDGTDPTAVDDPRIERLAHLLVSEGEEPTDAALAPVKPVPDEFQAEAKRYFKSVTTGRRVLERLTSPPLSLEPAEAVKRLQGSLLGPDGRQTCVIVSLHNEALGHLKHIMGAGQHRIFRPNVPPGLLRQLIMAAGVSLDDVHLGGPPVDNAAIDEEGERTLVRLAGVSGLLGLVLAYWALRSFLLTIIVFVASVTSAAASLGTVWLTGQTMDAILMSMPSLVYVLSISGAVHLINYYRDAIREHGMHGAVERAVAHAWKPAMLSSVTTALGLISLYASELVPIQKFGLYSAVAMMTLVGILFLFLPAALHITKIGRRWERKEDDRAVRVAAEPTDERLTSTERFWQWFAGRLVANHALVMITCLSFIAAIGWGITRNTTSINLLELFDGKARILRDYAWLEKNLGVLVPLEIVLKFDKNAVLPADQTQHESKEDLYRLSFLERLETVARVQQVIAAKFGATGEDIIGSSMSAVSFAPTLPEASGNTMSFMHRKALNMRLDSSRQEFIDAGFLEIDPVDGAELWRISLRVAAFKGVDYGELINDMQAAVQPVVQAHADRDRILRQISAWSPDGGPSYTGARVLLWDRTGQSQANQPLASTAATDPHVASLTSMLVNARCRVYTSDADPSTITLTNLERLQATDAVVLLGEFSESDMRTIAGSLPQVIVAGDHPGSRARRMLAGDPGIGDRAPEMHAVYTGVVPIVYKAQRALLDSLVESTLWSFLTITPLMMIVSRSIFAGAVAMIPNVLPVLVIFGAMGWMGIAIDIGSMMTASIALGVAVDDTIHFLSWYRADLDKLGNRREAIVTCYAKCATPTLQAALISGLGLSVFALSTFTPTQRFGWLMLSILVAGVVAELLMLPALLAGPLGVVFKARVARHTLPERIYLVARYRWRRWRRDGQAGEAYESVRNAA